MTLFEQYKKVSEFIQRGEYIKSKEYQHAEGGFPFSFVGGPLFDAWMGEINIFNERYLKKHPLYKSIYSTYFHRGNKPSAFDDMMGYLRALYSDDVFFDIDQKKEEATKCKLEKHLSNCFQKILNAVRSILSFQLTIVTDKVYM